MKTRMLTRYSLMSTTTNSRFCTASYMFLVVFVTIAFNLHSFIFTFFPEFLFVLDSTTTLLIFFFVGRYLLCSLFKTEKRAFVMKVKQPQKLPSLIFSHVESLHGKRVSLAQRGTEGPGILRCLIL